MKISDLGTNVIVKASGVVVQSHLGGLAIEVCMKTASKRCFSLTFVGKTL